MRTAALALALLCSTAAHAGTKRIAVLDFPGGARSARDAVVASLGRHHQVVARGELVERLASLGLGSGCAPGELVAIASALEVEAVLCGRMLGPRRAPRVVLDLYNGGDGRRLRRLSVRAARPALDGAAARLALVVERAWRWEAVAVGKASAQAALAPDGDRENPLVRRAPAAAVQRRAPAAVRAPRVAPALTLGVGPATLLRRNYRVYDAASPADGQGWVTSPVAGLQLEAELYPAAFVSDGVLGELGLGLSYARYFGLGWRLSSDPASRSATHQALAADLRWRHLFGGGARRVGLTLRGGYRYQSFTMNDEGGAPAVIPDVVYSSVSAGVRATATVIPRYLELGASFDYLFVLSRGELESPAQYGAATGGGLLGAGEASGRLVGPLGWQLRVEYAWYTVEPDASGARRAGTLRDRYLSGALLLTCSL